MYRTYHIIFQGTWDMVYDIVSIWYLQYHRYGNADIYVISRKYLPIYSMYFDTMND